MHLNEDHLSIVLSGHVKEIINPIVDDDLSFFMYCRIYKKNNKILTLTTRPDWHMHFWKKYANNTTTRRMKEGVKRWEKDPVFKQSVMEAKSCFGIANKVDITTEFSDYYEVLGFGSKENSLSTLCDDVDKMRPYGLYFKEKAKGMINRMLKNSNNGLLSTQRNGTKELSTKGNAKNKLVLDLISKSKGKVELRRCDNTAVSLSWKEVEFLYLYLKGKPKEEISDQLFVSVKTLDYYLSRFKVKIMISSKEDLFNFAMKNKIFNFFYN